ncbi:amidotransferase-related protein [hydrothermal vent metagenome]|uniref:Amidotransferase-related protein n=1 Tax=hydrothermal vent metagenome TaxID=652676 RepID=A0A3B0YGY9_9ZZZZ
MKRYFNKLVFKVVFFIFVLLQSHSVFSQNTNKKFDVVESTISKLHLALTNRSHNCESIITLFLNRIKRYDQSTKLNAIILINKNALKKAKLLDQEFSKTKQLRALHCVPVILKDNFDTADMPTEAGSIALQGSVPPDDAFMVKKLRDAGAIIIAKSNMGEWAFSAYNTISSTHGETRNAYNLDYVPAGSSGGTASAIAASFGIIGMGTDTGNSIRGPASHLALVGMRSTMGLTSRDGVVPLVLNRDIAGPLTRTVKDAAKTFNVIAGYDAADPITHNKFSKQKIDYTKNLKKNALKNIRLGVIRQLYETELADFEVMDLMEQAIEDLKSAGAIIIDPFEINDFKKLSKATGFCSRFRYDLNNYLNTLNYDGKNPPKIKRFQDMVDKNLYNKESTGSIKWAASVNVKPQDQHPPCIGVQGDPRRKQFLGAVIAAMDKHNLDAIIYPTWSNPPRKIADNSSPHGNNSPVISPHTGQPSITVPMGFTQGNLPAGLQFLGRPFDDAKLFAYAYAYEQFTQHRKPPVLHTGM